MYQSPDPLLLAWVADERRILLTHDVKTMPRYAYQRIDAALPMPGVIVVHQDTPIGQAIDDLELVIGAGKPDDFENQIKFIPLP